MAAQIKTPPGTFQPPSAPPSKSGGDSSKKIIVVLAVIILLAAIGAGVYFFFLEDQDTEDVVIVANTTDNTEDTNEAESPENNSNIEDVDIEDESEEITFGEPEEDSSDSNTNTMLSNENINTSSNTNLSSTNINTASEEEEFVVIQSKEVVSPEDDTKILGYAEVTADSTSEDFERYDGFEITAWSSDNISVTPTPITPIGGTYLIEPVDAEWSYIQISLNEPLNVKIWYTDDALGDNNESDLAVYYKNPFGDYTEMSTIMHDTSQNYFEFLITKPGTYTIFNKETRVLKYFDSDGDGYDDQTEIDNGFDPFTGGI